MARLLPVSLLAFAVAAPWAVASWSDPTRPPGCSLASPRAAPLVVFPSSKPTVRSGSGALLWSAPHGCAANGSPGAAEEEVAAAKLAGDAPPGSARPLAGTSGLTALTAATGTAVGQVAAVGSSDAGGVMVEGRIASTRLGRPRPLGGPAAPAAAFSAYLGDVAVASPVRTRNGWAIAVRTQRHYQHTLGAARLVPVGPHPVAALAVTLDFRAEALLVWASGGAIYACELPQSGRPRPVHRLAELEAGSRASEVQALLSDDGHAIVVWRAQSSSRAPATTGAPTTTVSLSISGTAVAFASPRLLERFRDPDGFVPPAGSLRLIRLSSEAVMLAWTGVRDGRYAVLASPVSLYRGAWAPVAISAAAPAGGSPAQEAVLSDIAPGPDAEAVAMWRVASRLPDGAPGRAGRAGSDSWAIRAARGHYAGQGEVSFDAPEQVAPDGFNGPPAVAIDPATGTALAAWVSSAGTPHMEYALRAPTLTPTSARATVRAAPLTALACCLGLPYASIDNSAIRIGTPLAACLK